MSKVGVIAVASVFGLLVVAVGVPTLLMQASKTSSEARMKETFVKEKLPTTIAELYPAPTVPDDKNAFKLVDQIFAASKKPGMVEVKAPKPGDDWDVDALRRSVASRQDMLDLAEQAANRPEWVPVRSGEGPNVMFPEFATMKGAAKALAERSRLRAFDGDMMGSVRDGESVIKLSDLVRKEPVLIGGLVSIATHSIAYTAMAENAAKVRHDRKAMDELVRVTSVPVHNDFYELFKGEATMSYYLATHRVNWQEFSMGDEKETPAASKLRYAKMELDRPYWGPILVNGWADYLKQAKQHPADIELNQKALDKFTKISEMKDDRLAALQIVFPVFSQAFEAYRKELAQNDLLRIAVKALRDGTTPDVTGTVDPFTGKPYKVLVVGRGWKVYSVGTDRLDDKGVYTTGSVDNNRAKNDIVFTFDGVRSALKGR